MAIGERIKAARLEAGLSQRQLCGQQLTRNMLSQVENGTARPSMKTLEYLAAQLGKSVSFFLDEQAVVSPNQDCMAQARLAMQRSDWLRLQTILDSFRQPDELFEQERLLLQYLCYLERARQALHQRRQPFALALLEKAGALEEGIYITRPLLRERQLLLAAAGEAVDLSGEDHVLLLRAQQAADPQRQLELLAAVENKAPSQWNYLQAEGEFALGQYEKALSHYEKTEPSEKVWQRMEVCCRELGDYKRAYEYACRQR